MKKIFIFAIAAAMLLCTGCGKTVESAPTVTPIIVPTPEPTPIPTPEPDSVLGTVKADVMPMYTCCSRGDKLTITGNLEKYYVIVFDDATMFVEKTFVRRESEEIPEAWSGFAKSGAQIFDNAYLTGEVLASPELNTVVEVLDQLNGVAFVKCGDISGYMKLDMISETQIVYYYDGGGGGGGGASSGGGGAAAPSDGGEIVLGYRVSKGGIQLLSNNIVTKTHEAKATKPISAIVFTDKLPVYLLELKMGDGVKITETGESECKVLCDEKIGTVPAGLLRLDSDEPYTQWSGFARSNAPLYSNYLLTGETTALETNTIINVLDDLGSVYVVEVNGTTGYMSHDDVSESEIVYYSYNGGGGGGGGGAAPSGGGGGAEWSEPMY